MDSRPTDILYRARQDARLSQGELWLRYFALGGRTAALEIEAALHGALEPEPDDRDRIVHALNERFRELGRDTQLPYSEDA